MQDKIYDICVVGSGAGAGPIIYELSKAGFNVIVLEKGPWMKTEHFSKDELVSCRRSVYTPNKKDEFHVIEDLNKEKKWVAKATRDSGKDYWNGNCVGGSSNFMSAYFHRMKPKDFKLLSEYGPISGANIVDWPIGYEDMEPFYTKVESVVGVSGEVRKHSTQEPRSTPTFPYPPLKTNMIGEWIDKAGEEEGYQMVQGARGILSKPKDDRSSCYYSNFCGSYGCSSNAKGSSRVALLNEALKTGNCEIIPNAKVYHLETNGNNKLVKAHYYLGGEKKTIKANTFVVACQAIETSRLLLASKNEDSPNGIGNENGLVGKNLIFSAGGVGGGHLYYEDFTKDEVDGIKSPNSFINRAIQHWYEIDDEELGGKVKGGTIDFIYEHTNPMPKLSRQKWEGSRLVYGTELKSKVQDYFTKQRRVKFEIFNDWLPTDNCYVELDKIEVDKWGDPVAKVRIGYHPHDLKVAKYLAEKGKVILNKIGAKDLKLGISGAPSPNLVVGGCRFGIDPEKSVLDVNCKIHSVSNLYITDGSFMPTGGSVPYTWTIYANSFRVADHLLNELKK
jgi:choline dehydrogenase-like flavoprotein